MKKLEVYSVDEYIYKVDDIIEDFALKDGVVKVYIGFEDELNENLPIVGCEYDDGTYSIVGLGVDTFCSYEVMIRNVLAD